MMKGQRDREPQPQVRDIVGPELLLLNKIIMHIYYITVLRLNITFVPQLVFAPLHMSRCLISPTILHVLLQ